MVGGCNTPFSIMDRMTRQINKETEDVTNTRDGLDVTEIRRTLHSTSAEYIFFSCVYGTFSRIGHMLDYKTYLNKFKKNEIIQNTFSDHSEM